MLGADQKDRGLWGRECIKLLLPAGCDVGAWFERGTSKHTLV